MVDRTSIAFMRDEELLCALRRCENKTCQTCVMTGIPSKCEPEECVKALGAELIRRISVRIEELPV